MHMKINQQLCIQASPIILLVISFFLLDLTMEGPEKKFRYSILLGPRLLVLQVDKHSFSSFFDNKTISITTRVCLY